MNNVIVAWVNKDEISFEKNIPLRWCGQHNIKLGSKNPIFVLFCEGFKRLSDAYISQLRELGYSLINCEKQYKKYEKRFNVLSRFGDYEKKCFLRWLVIYEIYGNDPVIHYDGDIIFNEIPEILEKKIGNLTFVLQGCPAVVSTGKSEWLAEYSKNLLHFTKNIDRYSSIAWKERIGWEESYLIKWSGSRFREIISSDQDLISHLIHTDRLPQTQPKVIKEQTADLVLFEQLLEFDNFYQDILPIRYRREDGADFFNNKKVAIWHMQSFTIKYLTYFLARGFLNRYSRCKNYLQEKSVDYYVWVFYDQILFRNNYERLKIYQHFFEHTDFRNLFNSNTYWKKQIFI